jgi:hypothetical protein
MPRALCLALTLFLLPLGPASAGAPADRGANAALKYWQAFATLPTLTKADQTNISEALTGIPDAHAREIVGKANYSLQMMLRGAALRRCDWGIDYEDGAYTLFPYAPAARTLCNLACLRARLRFAEGRNAEAVEDLVGAMKLGRHVSRDGIFILVLLGYAIEHRALETLAADLPRLNKDELKALKGRLDALPPFESQAEALRYEEKGFLDWFVRKVRAAKSKESLLVLLADLFDHGEHGGAAPGKGRAVLEACGGTATGVLKAAEETRSSYQRMAKKLDLLPEQFDKEYQREVKKQAANPLFKHIFPALEKVRAAKARADIRRALLMAAIAVRQGGQDALKAHPDPIGGESFEYVARDGGFELRSRSRVEGRPVTLTIGRAGK